MPSFSWQHAPRPFVCLAPMAGVTDASYRQLIKTISPGVIVYSEFLSTDALAYGGKKTISMMRFDPVLERPFIVQIFGKRPEHFLEAAKVVEQMGADGIDINMGCPAAKVVSSSHGSALMKNQDLAAELVAATVKAVSIPVSVKTRLGWDSKETLIPFCRKLIEAGASALAVHGRTFKEQFGGKADWEPIYELKRQVSIPVIGNGDIFSAADAVAKLENLDGVMVGRGTIGNPWLMREICDAFSSSLCSSSPHPLTPSPIRLCSFRATPDRQGEGEQLQTQTHPSPVGEGVGVRVGAKGGEGSGVRELKDKIPVILEHCRLAVKVKGEKRGMMEMRRHLAGYVKGFPGAAELRAKLVRVEKVSDVEQILATVAGLP